MLIVSIPAWFLEKDDVMTFSRKMIPFAESLIDFWWSYLTIFTVASIFIVIAYILWSHQLEDETSTDILSDITSVENASKSTIPSRKQKKKCIPKQTTISRKNEGLPAKNCPLPQTCTEVIHAVNTRAKTVDFVPPAKRKVQTHTLPQLKHRNKGQQKVMFEQSLQDNNANSTIFQAVDSGESGRTASSVVDFSNSDSSINSSNSNLSTPKLCTADKTLVEKHPDSPDRCKQDAIFASSSDGIDTHELSLPTFADCGETFAVGSLESYFREANSTDPIVADSIDQEYLNKLGLMQQKNRAYKH